MWHPKMVTVAAPECQDQDAFAEPPLGVRPSPAS